jgi:hypothetical protein
MRLPTRIAFFGVSGSGKSTLGNYMATRYGFELTAFAAPLKRAVQTIFGFDEQTLYGPAESRDKQHAKFVHSGWCFDCGKCCQDPSRLFAEMPTSCTEHWPKMREQKEKAIALLKQTMRDEYWLCTKCGATYSYFVSCRQALQTLGTAWGRQLCGDIWIQSCLASLDPDRQYVITDGRFFNERDASLKSNCVSILLMRGIEESTNPHPSEKEVQTMAKEYPESFTAVLRNDVGTVEENCHKLMDLLQSFEWPAEHTIEVPA